MAPAVVVAGAILFAVVCFVATSRFGAPRQLWYVVVASWVAFIFVVLAASAPSMIMARQPEPLITVSEVLLRAAGQTPFVRWSLLLLAAFAYPLGSWLGCVIGSRRAARTSHT